MPVRLEMEFALGERADVEHELKFFAQSGTRVLARDDFLNRLALRQDFILPANRLPIISHTAAAGNQHRDRAKKNRAPKKMTALLWNCGHGQRHASAIPSPSSRAWQI